VGDLHGQLSYCVFVWYQECYDMLVAAKRGDLVCAGICYCSPLGNLQGQAGCPLQATHEEAKRLLGEMLHHAKMIRDGLPPGQVRCVYLIKYCRTTYF